MAASIARDIRSHSPANSSPVALLTEDSLGCIASMLGAAKAERIFIPLDLTFPETYLAEIIADSGATLILADAAAMELAKRITGAGARVIRIGENSAGREIHPVEHTTHRRASDAAYILYTSGSTGKPKGVVLSHEFLIRYVDVWSNAFQILPGDHMSLLFSCNWGTGMHNTFVALLSGACVCSFDIRSKGIGALSNWLSEFGVTILVTTSSLFRTWIASVSEGQHFPALRLIRNVSEPLYSKDLIRAAPHFAKSCLIVHTFGTTETGTAAIHALELDARPEAGILPVGSTAPGIEILLEDENGGFVGSGQAGEIVLRGRYLALGYWNDPALTKSVFRSHPDAPGMRSYRSGDFGRWREDGQLEYLGRKDRKVKLRGFTIELYEIERALLRFSEVREAVVLLHKGNSNQARLVAYVVGSKDCRPELLQSIGQRLASHLPAHMLPSEIIVLESLPLTARGKVDRNGLPPPADRGSELAYRAPSSELEWTLAAIWEEALGIPKIGVDEDFYELGGTSLQAFLIFARIATNLGRDLPPTSMMNAPTIARQAAMLCEARAPNEGRTLVPFRTSGRGSPLFIMHGGRGDIMFVRQLEKELKSDRPIYGLQPPPLNGFHRVPRKMESIAADYLSEIRKVQPTGPYCLAGYSFGGSVALEMAQQLTRTGESVAFLGLIDTNYDAQYVVAGEKLTSRLNRHARQMRQETLLNYLNTRAAKTLDYYYRLAREAASQLPNEMRRAFGRPIPYPERVLFYSRIYFRATRHYSRRPYPGAVAMFVREGTAEWHRERWLPLALGGLTVREIPAGHTEMVWPPHSTMLAEGFDACLDGIS
jgi:amino acid adenylation domain-containing protein